MIVTTTDPITGATISNTENHPFVIEGEGDFALKIYFESESTKRQYLESEIEHEDSDYPEASRSSRYRDS